MIKLTQSPENILVPQNVFILLAPFLILGIHNFLYSIGLFNVAYHDSLLFHFDAGWYRFIMERGYEFSSQDQSNSAFFPLFPYLWKWLGISKVGISMVNMLFFASGALILKIHYGVPNKIFWILYLNPANCFMFFPYSEALFFICASVLLVGIKNNNYVFLISGVLLACLTRSISIFLILGSLFTLLITKNKSDQNKKTTLIIFSTAILALLIVVIIQFQQTGVWFAFAKAQETWEHYLKALELPLFSISNASFQIDITSMIICTLMSVQLLISLFKNKFQLKTPYEVILSISYLGFLLVFTIFFQGGEMKSLGRYVLASPFLWVILTHYSQKSRQISWELTVITAVIIVSCSTLVMTSSNYLSWHGIMTITSIVSFLIPLIFFENKWKKLFIPITVISAANLIFFINLYLSDIWVG